MRRALTLPLLCLALSACGGDGEGEEESSQFQRSIDPQAQERAESILLTLSDFPDGWRAGPAEPEDEGSDEAFNDCVGVDYSKFTLIGDAQSDDFAMGEAAEASSDAEVFESEGMAEAAVSEFTEAFSSEAANACMDELLGEFEDDTVEITEAELGELSFTPPAGVDEASAWQVVFTIEGKPGTAAAGVSVDSYIDLIQLRSGDATAEVNTLDILSPFDPVLRDELVAAVAGRMGE